MKKKYWVWGILVLAIIGIYEGWQFYKEAQANKIAYREVRAVSGPIQFVITSTGIVSPENRLEIKPPIAGRIEEIDTDEGRYVKKNQILAWMSSTDRAALLDAARAQGEKELSEWKAFYKPTPVLAPLSGLVIANNIVRGQTVTAQDVLIVLSDRLLVNGQVDETDLSHIKLNQHVDIVLDAFPDKKIPAKVYKIAYEAKTVNNVTVYQVEVLPFKQESFMRSGMSASLTFVVDSRKQATLLPIEAVIVEDDKSYVLTPVKDKNSKKQKPEKVEIRTGINNNKFIEITSGIRPGETVLIAEKNGNGKNFNPASSGSNPFNPMGSRSH